MDSTTASAETEARHDGTVLLAPRKAISQQESRGIRSVAIAGEAGQLEAILNQGEPDARFAALVCHPHPLGGGNLHNKVVYHAMKVLNDAKWGLGWPVLRFNFRGTGLSEGAHDGEAETGDVLAGMNWLEREFGLPLIVAGFSFGAAMALRACCLPGTAHRDVRALVALGLPTKAQAPAYEYSFLQNLSTPKLFLSGDRDQFASAEQLAQAVVRAAEPKRLILIPGADHFFTDQLEAMQRALAGWLKELLP
jgi:alpha/beta superfamily hydrolase